MDRRTDRLSVPALLDHLRRYNKTKYQNYICTFQSLKTNVERVNFAYKVLYEIRPSFSPFIPDNKKDDAAVKARLHGNDFFKRGHFKEALEWFTRSVSLALSPKVLALAYANRSAALSKLDLHEECLMDIERALEAGYPNELKPKLVKRREQSEAQKVQKQKPYEPVPEIPELEKNPSIECAKNCIKIEKSKRYGKHVIATRDIEIGEIIAVEKPYDAVVGEGITVHCQECLELCYNLIPCDSCTKVMYCSEICKEKASASYHKYECPILLSVHSCLFMSYSQLLLALKMLFSKKYLDYNPTDGNDGVYRSHRLKEVYGLERHADKDSSRLFHRSITAAVIFHLIKNHTTFLQEVNESTVKDHLLNLILIHDVNSVNVNELMPSSLLSDLKEFGQGLYPLFSLFNHSCWENVVHSFHGSHIVLRAIRTIKKGEQCFVTYYGYNYWRHDKYDRQNVLSSSDFFTCICRACKEDWSVPLDHPLGYSILAKSSVFFPKEAKQAQALRNSSGLSTAKELSGCDPEVAKQKLTNLLVEAKKVEKKFARDKDFEIRYLLKNCFDIFGNKRRIWYDYDVSC